MAQRTSKIMTAEMIASREKAKFDSLSPIKLVDGVLKDGYGNIISSVGGSSYQTVFQTLAELQAKYPNGINQKVYVIGENAEYYWSGVISEPTPDSTPPVLTITSGGNFTGSKSVTMTTDETATIYYTDDNTDPKTSGTKKTYSSALTLTSTKTIKAYAKDTAGNESTVQTITYTLVVSGDTTPPVLTITPSSTFATTQNVSMTTDETATIYYTDDNTDPKTSGTKKTYSSALTLSATTTIKAYAKDTAGNESVVQTVTYTKQSPTSYYVPMDGMDDYMKLPSMQMDSIEIDMVYDSAQTGTPYIVDARNGLVNGYFHGSGIGSDWTTLYVDGVSVTKSASSIPKDTRTVIKLVANASFTDDVNIFSVNYNSGVLKGKLYKVTCYLAGAVVAKYDLTSGDLTDKSGNGKANATLGGGASFVAQ